MLVLSKQTDRCSSRRFAKLRCEKHQNSNAVPVAHTLCFMQSTMTSPYCYPASHSSLAVGNALRPPRHIALTMAKTDAKQPIGVPEPDAHISMYEQSKWPLTKRDQTYLSQANKFWSFISTDAFLVGFALYSAPDFVVAVGSFPKYLRSVAIYIAYDKCCCTMYTLALVCCPHAITGENLSARSVAS